MVSLPIFAEQEWPESGKRIRLIITHGVEGMAMTSPMIRFVNIRAKDRA